MRVIKVFFLGLLYGWFMKWIIDEIYTKDNLRMITNENEYLRDRIKALEASRPQSLSVQPSVSTPEHTLPAPRPVPQLMQASSRKDDLKLIKGVGPKMEEKLNKAGVTTFDQMSRLTATELQAILGISKRVVQNTDNLISQAKKFARQNTDR
jgi:predicted flap endonuclease-1-like 5' DNA nuclease